MILRFHAIKKLVPLAVLPQFTGGSKTTVNTVTFHQVKMLGCAGVTLVCYSAGCYRPTVSRRFTAQFWSWLGAECDAIWMWILTSKNEGHCPFPEKCGSPSKSCQPRTLDVDRGEPQVRRSSVFFVPDMENTRNTISYQLSSRLLARCFFFGLSVATECFTADQNGSN